MRKALLVGINRYQMPGSNLSGCVNDVLDMRRVLKNLYGWTNKEIRMLVDERATKLRIMDRLIWLIAGTKAGDTLLFHYSGHGCFSGDTKVLLLDGTARTMEELARDFTDREFWVYSCTKDGKVVPGRAHSPRQTKVERVVRVQLDNGEQVRCTADHRFMLKTGEYRTASDLRPGDSLMPLYRMVNRNRNTPLTGYELVMFPADKSWHYTHRVVAYGAIPNPDKKNVIHHRDHTKRNNSPENLQWMTNAEHATEHILSPGHLEKMVRGLRRPEIREKIGRISAVRRKEEWKRPAYRLKVVEGLRRSFDGVGPDDPRIMALHAARRQSHSPEAKLKRAASMAVAMQDPNGKFYKNVHSEKHRLRGVEFGRIANHHRWHENRGIKNQSCGMCVGNHKVVAVEWTNDVIPVFDISVDEHQNFALEAGVFVHNSQIVDRNGDELNDHMDEILCPYDMSWDGTYIVDDDLQAILMKVPVGVSVTFLFDSCHSGTATRAFSPPAHLAGLGSPFQHPRLLIPPVDVVARVEGDKLATHKFSNVVNITRDVTTPAATAKQDISFWAGCKENQTSADANFGGRPNGAFTYAFIRSLSVNLKQSQAEVLDGVRKFLSTEGYDQVPQLELDDEQLSGNPFLS